MALVNDENERPYKVHLCKTDISQNNNKFYDMEMTEQGRQFVVKLINGRIGYNGVTNYKDFNDLAKAKKFFHTKFHEKTHLQWENRDDEPMPGKYVVVELNNSAAKKEVKKEVKEEVKSPEPEKKTRGRKKKLQEEPEVKKEELEPEEEIKHVDQKVKDLMKCICDEDVHLGLLKQLKFNEEYGKPMDCLSLAQIETGYQILANIEKSIGGRKAARSATRNRAPMPSSQVPMHEINKYYSLIPHSFGFSIPPKIDTLQKIETERELLDALKGSIEAATELEDLKKKKSQKDIYQRLYERLPCNLEPVSKEVGEKIGECLKMRGPTHFYKLSYLDAFELKNPDELVKTEEVKEEAAPPKKRGRKPKIAPEVTAPAQEAPAAPAPSDDSKRLLWHGTRVTNVFSILMNGLNLPIGDRFGLMFGNGVYFANVPTKSANYCCPEASRRVFMLLCEVDTANPLVLYEADPDSDQKIIQQQKESVYASGKHTPRETVDINGTKAFVSGLETIQRDTRLLYDEYVMFDKDKFKIKYVVEVKVDKLSPKEVLGY